MNLEGPLFNPLQETVILVQETYGSIKGLEQWKGEGLAYQIFIYD